LLDFRLSSRAIFTIPELANFAARLRANETRRLVHATYGTRSQSADAETILVFLSGTVVECHGVESSADGSIAGRVEKGARRGGDGVGGRKREREREGEGESRNRCERSAKLYAPLLTRCNPRDSRWTNSAFNRDFVKGLRGGRRRLLDRGRDLEFVERLAFERFRGRSSRWNSWGRDGRVRGNRGHRISLGDSSGLLSFAGSADLPSLFAMDSFHRDAEWSVYYLPPFPPVARRSRHAGSRLRRYREPLSLSLSLSLLLKLNLGTPAKIQTI